MTASAPTRLPLSRLNPMPRCRWMVAGVAALLLHLTVLAVLLFVPGRALRDDDASQPVMVTLVTEPPVAQAPPLAVPPLAVPPLAVPPLAEPPPVEVQPEPPPPIAVPPPEPPPENQPPPETAPAPDIPPPPETAPAPDIPPPPEAPPTPDVPPPPPPPPAIPAPDTSPPRVPAPAAKPKAPRPRLTAPAHPVVPPSSATPAEPRADIIGPYRNSLAAHVQMYQRYPALARARREEGLVVLHVTIQRDGQIAAMSIEHGSGSEALDREALATLKRADPLPPIPAGVPGATLDLEFPLRFHLE